MLALLAMPLFSILAQPILFEAAARAEGRTTSPAPGAPLQTNVVQFDGSFGLATSWPELQLSGAYAPRVILYRPDIAGRDGNDLFNELRGRIDYRPSRTDRILGEQSFVYGQQDFSPLVANPGPGTPPVDPRLAPLGTLQVISSSSELEYQTATSRTTILSARAGFLLSGGADDAARTVLPLQHTVSAGFGSKWATTETDRLSLGATGTYSSFTNGNVSMQAGLEGSWHTQLGGPEERGPFPAAPAAGDDRNRPPTMVADLAAGLVASRTTDFAGEGAWTPGLIVSGAISRKPMFGVPALNGAIRASVRSTIDPLTGEYYELADGSAALGYAVTNALIVQTSGSVARALTGAKQEGDTLVMGELGVTLKLGQGVSIATGLRTAWHQPADTSGVPAGTQWAGFATVGFVDKGRF